MRSGVERQVPGQFEAGEGKRLWFFIPAGRRERTVCPPPLSSSLLFPSLVSVAKVSRITKEDHSPRQMPDLIGRRSAPFFDSNANSGERDSVNV